MTETTYTRPHMWSFVPNEAGTGTVGVCSRCGCGENSMPPGGCVEGD